MSVDFEFPGRNGGTGLACSHPACLSIVVGRSRGCCRVGPSIDWSSSRLSESIRLPDIIADNIDVGFRVGAGMDRNVVAADGRALGLRIATSTRTSAPRAGIGQLPSYVTRPFIREGRPVHLLVKHTSERIGLSIYHARCNDLPAHARLLINFPVAKLRA